jgi:hypothetical protein
MGVVNQVRHSYKLRCHDKHTKFHKYWSNNSKVKGEGVRRHTAWLSLETTKVGKISSRGYTLGTIEYFWLYSLINIFLGMDFFLFLDGIIYF